MPQIFIFCLWFVCLNMRSEGKKKRSGLVSGKNAQTKKAIVWLTEDSKDIEIFAGL